MKKRTAVVFLLAAMVSLVGAAALLSACGDGESEAELPARVREATALLAETNLSDLTEAEQETVESALREALGWAETVHVTSATDAQDIVFRPDGSVAMMRVFGTAERGPPEYTTPETSTTQTISVYGEPPARFCDGHEDPEMLMMQEYVFAFGEWQVSAEAVGPDEVPLGLLFSYVDLSVAEDAGFMDERGHQVRGLTVPFPQPDDPDATITLWVGLEDGLVHKLEMTLPGLPESAYPFVFDYDDNIEIEVPSEPAAPDCVPEESSG